MSRLAQLRALLIGLKGGLEGLWLYLTEPEYRELSDEMDNCPECIPMSGEFCIEHWEELDDHLIPEGE